MITEKRLQHLRAIATDQKGMYSFDGACMLEMLDAYDDLGRNSVAAILRRDDELAALRAVFTAADDDAVKGGHTADCALSGWQHAGSPPACDCARGRLRAALDKARGGT